ncbi:MAG: hypothetical protein DWI00_14675 [Planctomycetota bacterium]|nr:MAG: hypothetical protein DWI00_14675 [Planctomycetota bacterium]
MMTSTKLGDQLKPNRNKLLRPTVKTDIGDKFAIREISQIKAGTTIQKPGRTLSYGFCGTS